MAHKPPRSPGRRPSALDPHTPLCLSCGAQLDLALAWLASLRCHDCRDSRAPIKPTLVPAPTAARCRLAA
jgi:hypothetical protein